MEIYWTRAAMKDVGAACAYITRRSPKAAEKVEEHILESVARLADFPNMGRIGKATANANCCD